MVDKPRHGLIFAVWTTFQSTENDVSLARSVAMNPNGSISRRTFVKTTAVGAAAVIVPRHVLGGVGFTAPSDQLEIACVGVGSQGLRVMMELLQRNDIRVTSVCDVNSGSGDYVEWGEGELQGKVRELLGDPTWGASTPGAWAGLQPAKQIVDRLYEQRYPGGSGCAAYVDFRDLLEQEDADAVVIGTPDHLHAVIALASLNAGKHVYCQKPMAHSVEEARAMAAAARETGLATQVATGNSASEETRVLTEWILADAIGPVREVHNWSSRPFWPQGVPTPEGSDPVPDYLDWDRWLGPAAYRPYNEVYQPFVWRGWFDFGTSAIGDMGCYSFDTLFRVLDLQSPTRIESSSTPVFPESYPAASVIHFRFPSRWDRPVEVHWYDGGIKPPAPAELEGEPLPAEGMLLVGEKGKILAEFTGGRARLIPAAAMEAFEAPPKTLPRSPGHYDEWIRAAMGAGETPAANFEFAGRVTEAILLGNVAVRTGQTLRLDGPTITAPAEARDLLQSTYRSGWTL